MSTASLQPELDETPHVVEPAVDDSLPSKPIRARFMPDEFFGHQPSPRAELPDPEPLLENLTRCII